MVGGGVAGLAAALSLGQAGCDVVALERAPQFTQRGSGLALTRNGLTALRALGVDGTVAALGEQITAGGYVERSGRLLRSLPADTGLIGIHRRVLHGLLLSALPGRVRVRPGCEVFDVEPGGASTAATVRYRHDGREFTETADLVVGADGSGSTLRDRFHPGFAPEYSGRTCWRGITRTDVATSRFTAVLGPGAEFGVLPVGPHRAYWYGYVQAPAGQVLQDEQAVLRRYFARWQGPVPAVLAAVRPEEIARHDILVQRRPLLSYVRGRVVLVGDAAHTMVPTMGQGANTALEDAASLGPVLGAALAGQEGLPGALERFDRLRRPRTQRIVRESSRLDAAGSGVARPVAATVRNAAVRRLPAGWVTARHDWLLGWSAPTALGAS